MTQECFNHPSFLFICWKLHLDSESKLQQITFVKILHTFHQNRQNIKMFFFCPLSNSSALRQGVKYLFQCIVTPAQR